MQRQLSRDQHKAFYHDLFVESQVEQFLELVPSSLRDAGNVVLDVGGGCGFFGCALQAATGTHVRVLDADPASIEASRARGLSAVLGDALRPAPRGDEDIICFNLILHHLVGVDERATMRNQEQALRVWASRAKAVFVNEYIYESHLRSASGRLIYGITKSKPLSAIASMIARFVPSLRANTLGVGVRFRDRQEWVDLFRRAGYRVASSARAPDEPVSLARRLLLIRSCRRESFLLVADAGSEKR
jgi:SAM-dependent methyltransferase